MPHRHGLLLGTVTAAIAAAIALSVALVAIPGGASPGSHQTAGQRAAAQRLQQTWAGGTPAGLRAADGTPFAFIRIPALGASWRYTITQGVSPADIANGPGHFPQTQMPGQVGNFALAGHTDEGSWPFYAFDKLKAGDLIYIDLKGRTLTYRITQGPTTIPATDLAVLDPVPGRPGEAPGKAEMTIVTCLYPHFDPARRQFVTAELAHP